MVVTILRIFKWLQKSPQFKGVLHWWLPEVQGTLPAKLDSETFPDATPFTVPSVWFKSMPWCLKGHEWPSTGFNLTLISNCSVGIAQWLLSSRFEIKFELWGVRGVTAQEGGSPWTHTHADQHPLSYRTDLRGPSSVLYSTSASIYRSKYLKKHTNGCSIIVFVFDARYGF